MVSERNGSAPVEELLKNRPNNLQTVDERQAAVITGFTVKGLQQRRWLGKPPTLILARLRRGGRYASQNKKPPGLAAVGARRKTR